MPHDGFALQDYSLLELRPFGLCLRVRQIAEWRNDKAAEDVPREGRSHEYCCGVWHQLGR